MMPPDDAQPAMVAICPAPGIIFTANPGSDAASEGIVDRIPW